MFKELQTCECDVFFLKPIISKIYPADDLCMPHSDCALSNGILLYAHIRACPDKAAQMYFGSMIYAFVQPMRMTNPECLCASYTITYAPSSLRSLIIGCEFGRVHKYVNDQRVKTTLYVHLGQLQCGYFVRVIVIYMYRSVKRGVICLNCLSFAKYWVIKQGSDSLDN